MATAAAEPWQPLRQALVRFQAVRDFTLRLCAPLCPEDHVAQSMTEASPVKWQIAHVTWFFEQFLLAEFLPGYRVFHPRFAYLFNSYYNAVGERLARGSRGLLTRPPLEEVLRYRRQVEESVGRAVESYRGPQPEKLLQVLELGIQHEQQHQELILTDVKHLLAQNPLRPAYQQAPPEGRLAEVPAGEPAAEPEVHLAEVPAGGRNAQRAGRLVEPRAEGAGSASSPLPLAWLPFDGGLQRIGHEGAGFAFDNEGPPHRRFLEPFELSGRLATNAEFLDFVEDGGYRRSELWLDDGWTQVRARGWQAPLYWELGDGGWAVFTLSGMQSLDPREPVAHISWYEADAFARWAGARLPLEEEWEVACRPLPLEGNFVESGFYHPRPLALETTKAVSARRPPAAEPPAPRISRQLPSSGSANRAKPSAPLLRQAFGDLWEWTASPYGPYPGFAPAPGALGEYNGKFMCNQFVLRGGSCATSQTHIRPTYRNFFPPDARWQFSGIRLARSRR